MDFRHLFLTMLSIGIFLSVYAFADCEEDEQQECAQNENCSSCKQRYYYYYCPAYQRSCVPTEEVVVEPMWPSRREQHQLWDELTR
ncbi:MAG: hypothetical protein H7A37_10180 [Chlamydiales bacterium]|nr:hypothetical protein [Chlamydiia bacterium]MCP5508644.1 hypothetical protein [Chlamydiales bacterium]